jgi:uncharacterized protein DUF2786
MTARPDLAALDRLKTRIQGLRSKTTDNGCTESEALLAAAKVAELLDRYDLSLTDVEIRDAPCEQREYETYRKKRIPLDACIGAIANFCDCRVWREKNLSGAGRDVAPPAYSAIKPAAGPTKPAFAMALASTVGMRCRPLRCTSLSPLSDATLPTVKLG